MALMLLASCANAGTHIMQGDSATLSSATITDLGVYMTAGSTLTTSGTQPSYFTNTGGNSWKFTGSAADIGSQSVTLSPDTITMAHVIIGPSVDMTLNMGGSLLKSNFANFLCSDFASTCLSKPYAFGGTPGNVSFVNVDSAGKIATGARHKTALLTVGGSAIIGSGYSEVGAMPTNGLRVMGDIVTASSITVNGTATSSVLYGISVGSVTINTGGLAGQALCWKTNTTLSYCDSAVGVAGACTCH